MTDNVEKILGQRRSVHGEFEENAAVTWEIMRALERGRNWPTLPAGMRHSMYMISHKMSRIIVGDPREQDHWDDIGGYAKCVADRLRQPVAPYDGDDFYSALARAWSMERREAKEKFHRMMYERNPGFDAESADRRLDDRPGTPEDGGHHASSPVPQMPRVSESTVEEFGGSPPSPEELERLQLEVTTGRPAEEAPEQES